MRNKNKIKKKEIKMVIGKRILREIKKVRWKFKKTIKKNNENEMWAVKRLRENMGAKNVHSGKNFTKKYKKKNKKKIFEMN